MTPDFSIPNTFYIWELHDEILILFFDDWHNTCHGVDEYEYECGVAVFNRLAFERESDWLPHDIVNGCNSWIYDIRGGQSVKKYLFPSREYSAFENLVRNGTFVPFSNSGVFIK